ncbi:MAG: hypothetical protein CMB79_24370 [Filomicrobium sp.]|nr:hypothetical protein [Filomicrobium sp.]
MLDLPALFERANEHMNGDNSELRAGGDVAAQNFEHGQHRTPLDFPQADEWHSLLAASGLGFAFASERQIDQLITLVEDDAVSDDFDRSQHSDNSST